MRNCFKHVDKFVSIYEEGVTGTKVFERMKEIKKSHRRAMTLALEEERDEFARSKHWYGRDRAWEWTGEEEEQVAD